MIWGGRGDHLKFSSASDFKFMNVTCISVSMLGMHMEK